MLRLRGLLPLMGAAVLTSWGCQSNCNCPNSPTSTSPIGGRAGSSSAPTVAPASPRSVPTVAPTAAPTAAPTSAPTATAVPTTTPNPEGVYYPGPVRFVAIKLFSAWSGATGLREPPFDDGQGNQVAYLGETVIFDATPKNERNQQCETEDDPIWTLEDNDRNLVQLSSSNPYLLRVSANGRTGGSQRVHIFAEIDGVMSNHLWVVVR